VSRRIGDRNVRLPHLVAQQLTLRTTVNVFIFTLYIYSSSPLVQVTGFSFGSGSIATQIGILSNLEELCVC
jgi:hypothetical protein